ncbi:mechanosensitive ion channel family protein [Mesorhizobium sp. ZC-5]|uniref:mechanosensitive ion channel family protein n=1 Tax=Mesorhizobium sp. ZC-5 TaxID=2986066 RepID=UPI0021E7A1BF|nr:mechanosensitive ion channel family protein [Mesorhizobium sp. ZC-5]MCV3242156.1 mechanosensitive ion channel family protein [Mesorhizobium sp. ZC-5]
MLWRFLIPSGALCAVVLLSGVWLAVIDSPALAQTNSPTAEALADEKVQQLLKMLDDPDIRARLESKVAPAEADAPSASSQMLGWEATVRNHLRATRDAIPRIPEEVANAVQVVRSEIKRGTIVILFGALLALGFGAEWLFKRVVSSGSRSAPGRADAIVAAPESTASRALAELVPLVVFFIVCAGVFLAFEWPALVRVIVMTYLVAFVAARLVAAIARILLFPGAERANAERVPALLPMGETEAGFWYRRVVVFTSYLLAGWATISLFPHLGFTPAVQETVAYLLGIGLLAMAIEIVWRRPRSVETYRTSITNWFLTFYLALLWVLWVTGSNGLLWLGIYALLLPKAVAIAGQAAESVTARKETVSSANPFWRVMIVRGTRALVILLAVLWMMLSLRVHPSDFAENNATIARIMRALLQGVIILLVADLLWQLSKAYIDRKLELSSIDDTVTPAEAARRGRLRTLLPIFRNMLAVVLACVAVLMVLAGLGVQIAPLIAGAGIFGVAIGFGSQTLVKDVLSGVFFMLDDAFRVGEYIQSGSYKGTVESFSLRSVRLRHHRGPVFTVPFGDLGAVQNMSRDWVIDKFMIRVPFDTDVKKVKKLLKGIGAEMLADPELAPQIIETVKMKGVEQFGDFGMELSFAFMAKPGHQSVVRRRAYTMIQQAFAANGIEFAQPTVQVGGDDKPASAAAASAAERMRKEAALAAAAGGA